MQRSITNQNVTQGYQPSTISLESPEIRIHLQVTTERDPRDFKSASQNFQLLHHTKTKFSSWNWQL